MLSPTVLPILQLVSPVLPWALFECCKNTRLRFLTPPRHEPPCHMLVHYTHVIAFLFVADPGVESCRKTNICEEDKSRLGEIASEGSMHVFPGNLPQRLRTHW